MDGKVTCYDCNGAGIIEYCMRYTSYDCDYKSEKECNECFEKMSPSDKEDDQCYTCSGVGKIDWIDELFRE